MFKNQKFKSCPIFETRQIALEFLQGSLIWLICSIVVLTSYWILPQVILQQQMIKLNQYCIIFIQTQIQIPMKNSHPYFIIVIITCILVYQLEAQFTSPNKIRIQSQKYSVISGEEAQTKVSPQRKTFRVPFKRSFTKKPDIGLSVYNLQFDYNPEFSINVIQETSTPNDFQFYLTGRPSQTNIFNELFIMYIASDVDQFGIYMPGPKSKILCYSDTTAKLGIPLSSTGGNRTEQFTFNFKTINDQPVFPSNTRSKDIRVSVYLTGIQAQSETVENGYAKNSANFALLVKQITPRYYQIQASVPGTSIDILIQVIEFTVVYFHQTLILSEYQMNSNIVTASNFGGTFFKSSTSQALQPLSENSTYENTMFYFFGISQIECIEGQTINLLAVQSLNIKNNGKIQNIFLTFETQRNTYIRKGVYNYLQYKPRACTDVATCGIDCLTATRPVYRIQNSNKCDYCAYFCLTCTNQFNCTSCSVTRALNNDSLCVCANRTYYDNMTYYECLSCFDTNFCQTCSRKGVCETCYTQANFVFNNVLRQCQCRAGMYNSFLNQTNPSTNLEKSIGIICLSCPPQCVYCTNSQNCGGCRVPFYLMEAPQTLDGKVQSCAQICNTNERYNEGTLRCQQYNGDATLFDQSGRLGFDWSYQNINNELVVDLLFSQRDMTYYFYENGKGYKYVSTTTSQTQRNDNGQSSVFYDDGNGYIGGYAKRQSTAFQNSIINTQTKQQQNGYMFDQSALRGDYYGLGEAKFYSDVYQQILKQQQQQYIGQISTANFENKAAYYDQYNIPFGKHKLNNTKIADSATFLDAIRNNLIFMVNNQSLPYTIRALSGNQFELIVRPQTSYLTSNATIIFKNPALVRSNQTALQTPTVSKQIDRLDFYSQNQLLTATSLRDRTSTIVQILWGICKYILFIGFGWAVMPLMYILQYIFGHNYITSQLPLNLDYFLTSFADFRNPSILFNPQRNQFDAQVVNHQEIYKRIPSYYDFDRGIDFMKNSFQFFFTPLLSFGLQFLFIGLNCLLNHFCKRDIPLISKYFLPRLPLHAGAYTLVQALPISFFFFGQLQDTRYDHVKSPNGIYPSFNTGMSYASFFASAIIPIVLMTGIFHYFKKLLKSGTFQFNKVKGNDQLAALSKDPAMMDDPLWGGNPQKPLSYGFGTAVYYLPLLAGFVLSFFTKTYPWQLTGLLLGSTGLASFATGSPHFTNKIPKFFWAGIMALMVGYQLVHAGVGSNRALSTFDQWNTGYLGIGLIYAMLLAAIIFSGYLIYKLLTHLYRNIIRPFGCLAKLDKQAPTLQTPQDQNLNQREKAFGRDRQRKSTIAKNFGNLHSQVRMLQPEKTVDNIFVNAKNMQQQLEFVNFNQNGNGIFQTKNSLRVLKFPAWSSQLLRNSLPLRIDSTNDIYSYSNNNRRQLGNLQTLMQQRDQGDLLFDNRNKSNKKFIQMTNTNQNITQNNKSSEDALNMIKNNNSEKSFQFININGKPYDYEQGSNQSIFLRNYNNQPRYKLSSDEFLQIFSNNQNKVTYQDSEFYISKPFMSQETQEINYYLVDPKTYQNKFSLDKQSLLTLIAQGNNRNMQSATSLLNSYKNINQAGYSLYNPTNKNVVFSKDSNQFVIDSYNYILDGEDKQSYYLHQSNWGNKIFVRKSMILMKSPQQSQQSINMNELKQAIQNHFRQSQSYKMGSQSYIYQGPQNNKYRFLDQVSQTTRYFTMDELRNYLSSLNQNYNYKITSPLNNVSSANSIPAGSQQLKYVRRDENKNLVIYMNPNSNQTYQIRTVNVDPNGRVFIYSNVIYQNGKVVPFQRSEQNVDYAFSYQPQYQPVQYSQYNIPTVPNTTNTVKQSYEYNYNQKIGTEQSLQSNLSGGSLSDHINPNQLYDINLLNSEYQYSQTRLPGPEDIVEMKNNIIGSNVSQVINYLKQIYPQGKAFIQNVRDSNQMFLLDFRDL